MKNPKIKEGCEIYKHLLNQAEHKLQKHQTAGNIV